MKKIMLIAVFGTVMFTSCVKNNEVAPNNQVQATDAAAKSLRVAYPDASNIEWAQVTTSTLVANFTNKKANLLSEITKTGTILYTANSITDATLPAIALDYLTTNYPGYKLIKAGEKMDKNGATIGFMANIQVGEVFYHIHFDATGKFLSVNDKLGKHNGEGVKVTEANLIPAIKTYLTTTYPGYKFDDAISFSVNGVVKGYGVRITTADTKEIGLIFDGAGTFLRSREGDLGHHSGKGPGHGKDGKGGGRGKDGATIVKVELSVAPAAIKTYLDTKYVGYSLIYVESYALNAIINKYEVEFTLSGKTYEVYFDALGVFLNEKIKN